MDRIAAVIAKTSGASTHATASIAFPIQNNGLAISAMAVSALVLSAN